MLLPLCRQRVEQRVLRLDRMMQLPAQLSHKIHAQGVDVLLSRHRDVLGAQPREGFVGKVGIRQCREKIARTRSTQNKSAALQSVVDKLQRIVRRKTFLQKVVVETLGRARTHNVVTLFVQSRDRELAAHAARRVKAVSQLNPAVLLRNIVRDHRPQPKTRTLSHQVELGETRQIDETYAIAHGFALRPDRRKPVRTTEAVAILALDTLRRKPVRALPAVALSPNRAASIQLVVARALLLAARRRTFFHRIVDNENMLVSFGVLLRSVVLVRVAAEATRVKRQCIDRSFAVQDRLGKHLARSPRRRDAEAEAFGKVEITQPPSPSEKRVAVGRIRDRTIHNILDPRHAEGGNTIHRRLDMRRKAIDVARQKLSAEVRRNAVLEAQLRSLLVGTQDVALTLLPQIVGGIRFAQNRHLRQSLLLTLDQLRHIVRDDILVFHRNNRNIQSHHRRRLACIVTRRSNDRLANDLALLRRH